MNLGLLPPRPQGCFPLRPQRQAQPLISLSVFVLVRLTEGGSAGASAALGSFCLRRPLSRQPWCAHSAFVSGSWAFCVWLSCPRARGLGCFLPWGCQLAFGGGGWGSGCVALCWVTEVTRWRLHGPSVLLRNRAEAKHPSVVPPSPGNGTPGDEKEVGQQDELLAGVASCPTLPG